MVTNHQPQAYNPIEFEIAVQSIASDILNTPYDEALSRDTVRTARYVASLFNANREQIFKDFKPHSTDAIGILGLDVNSPKNLAMPHDERVIVEAAKKQFRSTAELIDNDNARIRAISEWLHSLPNPNRRKNKELGSDDIIESLLMIDAEKQLGRIAFSDIDLKEAESILNFEDREHERLQSLEAALDGVGSTEMIADMIMDRLYESEGPLTKLNVWTDESFRDELRAVYPGITNEQIMELFRSGWSYIEAYFKEIDPNFELFIVDNTKSRRGTRYSLNEKELVKELWDIEHAEQISDNTQIAQEVSESDAEALRQKTPSIRGHRLVFSDGTSETIESPVIKSLIDEHLKGLKRSDWLSRANVAQKIANELGLKKSEVETELIEFIKIVGKGLIETVYSRAGNRILLRKGSGWRH